MEPIRIDATGGTQLHVLVQDGAGAGLPVLLIHGLSSNARLWDGVAGELAGAGHPVAAVDQRGHGRSDKPDTGYDFATLAADLVAVLDGLGWRRAVVAGQSWGGNVVVELAARHPERVAGVVCVDGGWVDLLSLGPWEEVRDRLRPPAIEGTPAARVEAVLRERHPDWPESGIRGALACFEMREDGTVAPWLTVERHLAILRHLYDQPVLDVLAAVRAPTLLVPADDGSERARRSRDQVSAAERVLRCSRTRWFAADHDVHAQKPGEVAALLHDCCEEGFFA